MENDKIDNMIEELDRRDVPHETVDYRIYVRPFIGVSITCLVLYLGIVGKIEPATIITVFGTIAGFYFGAKD